MEVGKFVTGVIGITIAVIVISVVAVPIINENLLPTGEGAVANADTINTILTIVPVFLVIAVLIACIGMFIKSKA